MALDSVVMDSLKLAQPILVLSGEVEPPMFQKVAEAFQFLISRGSPDLEIIINSGGGSTSVGLDIFDTIRLYRGKVTGKVISRAASMAAIILQACTVRQCARHAEILIHHVSRRNVSLDVMKSRAKMKKVVSEVEKPQQRLYNILVGRTKRSKSEIVRACRLDKYMASEQAKEFGLIDEII